MDKYDLILKASVNDDVERLKKLAEYDNSVHNMKLYRYRPINDKREYELDALKSCKIWGSNPNLFDDEYELCVSDYSDDDYKFIEFYVRRHFEKIHRKPYKTLLNMNRMGKKQVAKLLSSAFRNQRERFVVSCFTENSPFGTDAMWHQYAGDHGICLEYSLKSFVNAHILIDPVYYTEKKSFGEVFKIFGEDEKANMMCCVKNKSGIDKNSGSKEIISWEQQREWRYLLFNKKDKNGKYLPGFYSPKAIKPDCIYVNGLNRQWIKKVEKAAKINRIPVIVLDAGFGRRFYERIKGYRRNNNV